MGVGAAGAVVWISCPLLARVATMQKYVVLLSSAGRGKTVCFVACLCGGSTASSTWVLEKEIAEAKKLDANFHNA